MSGLDGLRAMEQDLGAMRDRARDRRPFFVAAAETMRKDGVPAIFARGWAAPRAWDTGFALLRGPEDSIVKSIQLVPEADRLVMGTTHPGGRAHNLGAVITAKSGPYLIFRTPEGFRKKKSVRIPQRLYIYFPVDMVERMLRDEAARVMRGR